MISLERVVDLAKGVPLVVSITRMMQGALGVALFATPCYAVAAEHPGTKPLASASSAATKQPAASDNAALRPFRVNIPLAALDELRRRVLATQWPEKETVADQSQGVPLEAMRELARYWATSCDWRKVEAQLNALPQFINQAPKS